VHQGRLEAHLESDRPGGSPRDQRDERNQWDERNQPNGAAAAFETSDLGATFSGTTFTPMASESLPAGKYTITGSVGLSAEDTQTTTLFQEQCELADGDTQDLNTWTGETNYPAFGIDTDSGGLSFGIALTTTATTTVSLSCGDVFTSGATGSFATEATSAEISAVQVNSLTATTSTPG